MNRAARSLTTRVFPAILTSVLTIGGLQGYASSGAVEVRAVAAEVAIAPETPRTVEAGLASALDAGAWGDAAIGTLDRDVLTLALESARAALADQQTPRTLTVIDFSKPSTAARLWVYDLASRKLLFEEHVAHGRNSGHNLATSFSNSPESYKSSIGLYRAAEAYYGKHGYSLRLDGLEPGFNDRARERAIVIHGADYVNPELAGKQGRLGRSLGCPAVRPEITRALIDAVKEGGLIFAYYPDPTWLGRSPFLN